MRRIPILQKAGSFAENKDVARDLRLQEILPALDQNEEVTIDFEGVQAATQSFVHALISDVLRKHGNKAIDLITFKSCNATVKKIIGIVIDYIQEGNDLE